MAVLAFAAVGSWIGSATLGAGILGVSGAAIGWTVGGMLGGMIGPSQKVQGPRLADLKLTSSAYGSPIPYVIGHPRIGGQIIWGSDRREISTTTSRGKGGPKVKSTTFTYEIDLLIQLTANEMAGVRKMFVNGELQWSAASDADYGTIAASGALARRITVYRGDADQLPDPTYEAAVGIGNAPAYRGVLTVFFEGLQLGNSGQIPNITFEVMQTSEAVILTHEIGETPSVWINAIGTPVMGPEKSTVMVGMWDSFRGSTAINIYQIFPDGLVNYGGTVQAAAAAMTSTGGITASGSTDEPVMMVTNPSVGQTWATWEDGLLTKFPSIIFRFAKAGNDVVCTDTTPTIYRYDIEGLRGAEPAPSAIGMASGTLPAVCNSLLIRDDKVYCLERGGSSQVFVLNLEDLTADYTITTPTITGNATILFDDSGVLHIMDTLNLWRWDGAAWFLSRTIPSGYGASGTGITFFAANSGALIDGVLYVQPNLVGSGSFQTDRIRASWVGADLAEESLEDVVTELCLRAGIEADFIDASALAGKVVRAYAITPSTTRAALEALSQAYQFESVCSDKLRFVPLGGAAKATIPFEDLGAAETGNHEDPLPLAERNDIELPAYITVKYMNVVNDYQDGAERSSRIATESEAEQFVEIAMGMTPSEAKQVADFMANLIQMTTSVGPVKLQLKGSMYQPTDVLLLQDRDGSSYRVRVGKQEYANGISTIDAVFDNASAIISDALTDEDYTESSIIRVPSTTLYVMGDWPLFRDADDNFGHYWAATAAGSFWPGAALMKSSDDVVYQQVSQVEERGIVGQAVTALANYTGPNVPDEAHVVRVNVGLGLLASITYTEQLQEIENAFMIGDECLIAREVAYVSPGVYDLSGLLRGRKGTDWAMGTHVAGEEVVLIQPAGIRRVGMDLSEWNLERYYRAVTFGKSLDSAITKLFANTGVSSIPYAPTSLDSTRNATQTTIFWNRRTRLSQNWLSGSVPLGEETERWQIRRYTDGTYTTIAETVESTTASYTFTLTTNPIYVSIRQWSARVGWGYELRGAI